MPLVIGFTELTLAGLLLAAAITGAKFADIITGRAKLTRGAAGGTSPTPGGTPTVAPAGGLSASASTLLNALTHRNANVTNGYSALRSGRVDQGKDFAGAGPVKAIADGVVKSVGSWHGWPGIGGIVYDTALGPVYVMEDFIASVHVGQRISSGQIIGHATGGSTGIETGLANAQGTGPLVPYNGKPDGTPTAGGQAIAALLGY